MDRYYLIDGNRRKTAVRGATWAEWDQQGRLVFAREGQFYSLDYERWEERLLADFNAQVPTPQDSPDWAKRW